MPEKHNHMAETDTAAIKSSQLQSQLPSCAANTSQACFSEKGAVEEREIDAANGQFAASKSIA